MPKAVEYKANSIVYFKGDNNDRVFLLKSGKVSLKYNDIETGQEMYDLIQTGEFFGVKSALGKYPREETAMVLQQSQMVVFTVPEFEQVVLNNTRIIMKMLKVFSNQLRRIQKQMRNVLSSEEQSVNPEGGLFKIGEYYLKMKRYSQALYAFRRYLTYYPSGAFAQQALLNIEAAERSAESRSRTTPVGAQPAFASAALAGSGGGPPTPASPAAAPSPKPAVGGGEGDLSAIAQRYYNAVSLFSQQKYRDALEEFKAIVTGGQDDEYVAKSLFEIGRCLFFMEMYDKCMTHFTTMIQRYPKHPDLVEALFYIGSCYEKKKNTEKAKSFFKKILSMSPEDAPVTRKARKAIRNIEVK
jgi:TolA-binding protein